MGIPMPEFEFTCGAILWLSYTVLTVVNLRVSEVMEYNYPLDLRNVSRYLYLVVGVPLMCALCGLLVIACLSCWRYRVYPRREWEAFIHLGEEKKTAWGAFTKKQGNFATILGTVSWLLLLILGFFPPFGKLRQYVLAKDGLDGTPLAINCVTAANHTHLMLPETQNYFLLEDPEWGVDWDARKNYSDEYWSYLIGEIRYTGPVQGCKFVPVLYAVCSVNQKETIDHCRKEADVKHYPVTMRRLHASDKVDKAREHFEELAPAATLFEFNTRSYEDTERFVDRTASELRTVWGLSLGIWVPLTLAALFFVYRRHLTCTPSVSHAADDIQTLEDLRPPSPAASAAQESAHSDTKSEYMIPVE
eukprot:TRINITY_DN31105_c0_g1_i2.p1 TRINITY_DN31105_c0_g1~~TRINITY_DN31105_c0_g1_i2.p1  ORF type:complete len:371 (+),score=97.98 TRINITY_DN31105_c0_g1_i2:33-1115(+)